MGSDFADIAIIARGPDRSYNSIPIILEMKSRKTTVKTGLD